MKSEELKLNDKELHKCIDELKGTQFLSAFYILDWIIKMRNENEELKEELKNASSNYTKYIQERDLKINKAIEFIKERTEYNQYSEVYPSVLDSREVKNILKILRGE